MLSWSSQMFVWNARPPNPHFVKNWKSLWRQRLESSSRSWVVIWLSHQLRGDYWKHGSVCEDPTRVQVPVLAIGENISYTLQMHSARCRHNTVNFSPNIHNKHTITKKSRSNAMTAMQGFSSLGVPLFLFLPLNFFYDDAMARNRHPH